MAISLVPLNERQKISIYSLQGLGNAINCVRTLVPLSLNYNVQLHAMKLSADFFEQIGFRGEVVRYQNRRSILQKQKWRSDLAASLYPNWKREIAALYTDPSSQKFCFSHRKNFYTRFNNFNKVPVRDELHDVDNNYALLEQMKVPFDANLDFYSSLFGTKAQVRSQVAVHPTASSLHKYYPAKLWRKLLDGLQERFDQVVVFSGHSEAETKFCQNILQDLETNKITLVQGQNFRVVSDLIASSSAFIGCDSSLSHLAALFRVPSLVLWANADYRRIYPYSPHSKVYLARESLAVSSTHYSSRAPAYHERADANVLLRILDGEGDPAFFQASKYVGNVPFYVY